MPEIAWLMSTGDRSPASSYPRKGWFRSGAAGAALLLLAAGCGPKSSTPPAPVPSAPTTAAPSTPNAPGGRAGSSAIAPPVQPPAVSAPSTSTPSPARSANTATHQIPGKDPIVGDWRVDQGPLSLYIHMGQDGKTGINLLKTRMALEKAEKDNIDRKAAGDMLNHARLQQVAEAAIDKQIRLFEEYHGTWKRKGDVYHLESYSSKIAKKPDASWAKVQGNQLVPTDEEGKAKSSEVMGTRD